MSKAILVYLILAAFLGIKALPKEAIPAWARHVYDENIRPKMRCTLIIYKETPKGKRYLMFQDAAHKLTAFIDQVNRGQADAITFKETISEVCRDTGYGEDQFEQKQNMDLPEEIIFLVRLMKGAIRRNDNLKPYSWFDFEMVCKYGNSYTSSALNAAAKYIGIS